jgi:hypothetical protein
MATLMPWGEEVTVTIEFGFPVNVFTLDSAEDGVLDDDYLDGTIIGDDISEYCRQISISRGRSDQLQQFNAGVCTLQLDNLDRRFDPINEASPYWDPVANRSGVVPRRKVTVESDGVPLFVGRITDVDVVYSPTPNTVGYDLGTVVVSAADDFVLLANAYTESEITPVAELSGARVTSILDLAEVNYPATRQIDSGIAGLGGGATFNIPINSNALTYLQQVATAEQGYFFVGATGDLVFTDRVAATFSAPSAYFSDNGTQIPYNSLEVVYGQEFLYNKVIGQRLGGVEQIANDVASQTDYGISTLSLDSLLLEEDSAVLDLVTDLLNTYSEPQYRFDRMTCTYNGLPSVDYQTLSGLELGQIVNIERSFNVGVPSSVALDFSIEALNHVITSSGHIVEFGLAYAVLLAEFTLDDVVLGVLDSNNALV